MALILYMLPFNAFTQDSFNPNVNIAICTAPGDQNFPAIASDGNGSAIIVWQDQRNANLDIFAQKMDALGHPQWAGDGVAIITEPSNQGGKFSGAEGRVRIVSDGTGGAILVWRDDRS